MGDEQHHQLLSWIRHETKEWTVVIEDSRNKIRISRRNQSDGPRTVWLCSAEISDWKDVSAEEIFNVVSNVEQTAQWNTAVDQYKLVETVKDQTDVTYVRTKPYGGGAVSARDFINMRTRHILPDAYIIAARGMESHPAVPTQTGIVRGLNGLNGYVVTPTHLHWILNSDLRGWLPLAVVDSFVPSVMGIFIADLRTHVSTPK